MSTIKRFIGYKYLYLIILILAFIPLLNMNQYVFYVLSKGLQNVFVVLSLVVLLGFTGKLSLGHAAFVAIGGYSYAILNIRLGFSPWLALIIAPFITAVIGLVIGFPSFKLRGPFLAVVTLAFGEITRILLLNWGTLTGGPYGLTGFDFLIDRPNILYYFMLLMAFLSTIVVLRIEHSKIGLALKTIKQDEIVAASMGIDVRYHKLLVFTISAFLAGLGGVFFANLETFLHPDSFTLELSATYLLMLIIGGWQSAIGTFISAITITALPEFLREIADYRMIIYSLALMIYIIVVFTNTSFPGIGQLKLYFRKRKK